MHRYFIKIPFRESVPVSSVKLPRQKRPVWLPYPTLVTVSGLVPGWERLPLIFFLFVSTQERPAPQEECTHTHTHTHTRTYTYIY